MSTRSLMKRLRRMSVPVVLGPLVATLLGIASCEGDNDGDGDGFTANQGDCDDADASVNPAATEVCDDIDNNCDSYVDEGTNATYYPDEDNDGFGDYEQGQVYCIGAQPTGYVTDGSDCADDENDVYPGATEVCDRTDQDCDGYEDEEGLVTVTQYGSGERFSTYDLQEAVDVAIHSSSVYVCHGDYYGGLKIADKRLSLIGVPDYNWIGPDEETEVIMPVVYGPYTGGDVINPNGLVMDPALAILNVDGLYVAEIDFVNTAWTSEGSAVYVQDSKNLGFWELALSGSGRKGGCVRADTASNMTFDYVTMDCSALEHGGSMYLIDRGLHAADEVGSYAAIHDSTVTASAREKGQLFYLRKADGITNGYQSLYLEGNQLSETTGGPEVYVRNAEMTAGEVLRVEYHDNPISTANNKFDSGATYALPLNFSGVCEGSTANCM